MTNVIFNSGFIGFLIWTRKASSTSSDRNPQHQFHRRNNMKHRLFLPALMCCLTLAAFGFFVFALVRDSMQGTPQKSFEGWYGQVLVPASELHDKLDRKYGFDSSPPPNHTNDRIIGFRFNLDHPEHAAEIRNTRCFMLFLLWNWCC